MLAVAAGYVVVPAFLFYHAAQLLAGAAVQLRRRFDGWFWGCQAGALALVGAFYLPAMGFSGLGALAANPYVRPFRAVWANSAKKPGPS